MRIRKNTKLSSLLSPHSSAQTHVCQLNQSPWDVIPFSSPHQHQVPLYLYPPSSSSSSPLRQFEVEGSLNGNGSLGESVVALESVDSLEKLDFMAVDDSEEMGTEQKPTSGVEELGMATDRIRAKKAKPMKPNSTSPGSFGGKKAIAAATKRGRPRGGQGGRRISMTESNPHEFYYYSGFGPRWGKRRGDRGGIGGGGIESEGGEVCLTRNVDTNDGGKTASYERLSEKNIDLRETDYIENEDEREQVREEEDGRKNEDGGSRRRTRKPVKARSLKSLM